MALDQVISPTGAITREALAAAFVASACQQGPRPPAQDAFLATVMQDYRARRPPPRRRRRPGRRPGRLLDLRDRGRRGGAGHPAPPRRGVGGAGPGLRRAGDRPAGCALPGRQRDGRGHRLGRRSPGDVPPADRPRRRKAVDDPGLARAGRRGAPGRAWSTRSARHWPTSIWRWPTFRPCWLCWPGLPAS